MKIKPMPEMAIINPKEYRRQIKTIRATQIEVFDSEVNELLLKGYDILHTQITELNYMVGYYAILTKYIEVIPDEDKARADISADTDSDRCTGGYSIFLP